MSIPAVHVLTNWNSLYNQQKFSDIVTYIQSQQQLLPTTTKNSSAAAEMAGRCCTTGAVKRWRWSDSDFGKSQDRSAVHVCCHES